MYLAISYYLFNINKFQTFNIELMHSFYLECKVGPYLLLAQTLHLSEKYPLRVVTALAGWPHSSQNEIPCVFPVLHKYSLCYFYAKTNN